MLRCHLKTLKDNQYHKSDKATFIIYADIECSVEKIDGCKNNPETSSTIKVDVHLPSSFWISTILSFKNIEKKYNVYRGKYCMKKFCISLREHSMEIISFFKKNEVINKRAAIIIWKCKRDHCHYTDEYKGAAHNNYNLKYSVPKEISIVFHNGSNYNYHFIIKELAEKLEGQFANLREIIEKYIDFSVPIEKLLKWINTNG